jgi:hypothetical protein
MSEPSEEFLQYVEEGDDDIVAICLDCFSQIPDSIAEKDPFLSAGSGAGVCMYCGGPVAVASASAVPNMKRRRASGGMLNS